VVDRFQLHARDLLRAAVPAASLQVRAGAEGAAGAGQHQAAHVLGLRFDPRERGADILQHFRRGGVEHLRMVERERRDAVPKLELDTAELHVLSSSRRPGAG
jgi:hypothetical protein